MVTQKTRQILIAGALVLTLVAVSWINQTESADSTQASAPEVKHKTQSQHTQDTLAASYAIPLGKLERPQPGPKTRMSDLFKSKSWYVPPPPPKPLPPAPPTAPPLPFTFLGKLLEEGKITVFLTKQDRNYVIKAGDVIDGTYRVDAIQPSTLSLTYLPLDIKQSMSIGDAN